jgi:hypothetical protein
MTVLKLQMDPEQFIGEEHGYYVGLSMDENEATVRIVNEDAENGLEQNPGPFTWLNSVRITCDRKNDAIYMVVSIFDPRGGYGFEIRRRPDTGEILIHHPHPKEMLPHGSRQVERISDSTLKVPGTHKDDFSHLPHLLVVEIPLDADPDDKAHQYLVDNLRADLHEEEELDEFFQISWMFENEDEAHRGRKGLERLLQDKAIREVLEGVEVSVEVQFYQE